MLLISQHYGDVCRKWEIVFQIRVVPFIKHKFSNWQYSLKTFKLACNITSQVSCRCAKIKHRGLVNINWQPWDTQRSLWFLSVASGTVCRAERDGFEPRTWPSTFYSCISSRTVTQFAPLFGLVVPHTATCPWWQAEWSKKGFHLL